MGWLILKDYFGPLVYGISFGIIAGIDFVLNSHTAQGMLLVSS